MDRFLAEYLLLGSVFSFTVGGLCLWRYVLSLRRRLTLYQSISTITKEAWAVWDLSGQFQECSSSFRNLFGCLPTGNISLREVICSFEDQDLFEKKLTDLRFSEGSFFQEGEMRHTHQQIHLQGAYISLSSRPILCLWAYDITQQQQIKRDLQENVRQAEEKCSYWRHFLDVFPFPIWHRRPKDLRLDYCNKAYAEATGLSPERILLEMPSPLSPALFGDGRNLAARARETGTLQCSSQGGVLRGEHHHFLVHEIPLGEGTLGFSFDVTEHHQIRRRLERNIAVHTEVFGILSTAIAIFCPVARLHYFNEAYTYLMGLKEKWLHTSPSFGEILEELRLKRKLPEIVDFRAYKNEQLALFQTVMETQRELMHLPNGHTLHVSIAPHPLGGLIFLYEDITSVLTLERNNNTLLSVQREMIDHLHEGISVFSSDNRLKLANQACGKIWDMTPEALIPGQHISEFIDHIKSHIDYKEDWESFKEYVISNLTDRIPKDGQLLLNNNTTINFTYTPLSDGTHLHTFANLTTKPRSKKILCGKAKISPAGSEVQDGKSAPAP